MAKRTAKSKKRCLCGCGESPKSEKGRFCMGHDARFHGRLKKLADGRLSMAALKKELGRRGTYALPNYAKAVESD